MSSDPSPVRGGVCIPDQAQDMPTLAWLVEGIRPYLILLLLCLGLYLPGIAALPPIDRDESRFAQASHQMLESGDFIRIRFQEEMRAKKPVGVYWLQAAAASLTGQEQAIWPYRLPSVLGALLAVLLTFHFGRRLVGPGAAFIGAALLASSFLLVSEAHQAKTDAVMLATIVAAQGVLGRFYLAGQKAGPPPGLLGALIFWVAQGVGILIKGPIVPVISLLTILFLWIADKKIAWVKAIRPISGLIVAAAIVAPWAAAVSAATEGQFIGQAVKTDLLPKLLGAQESHGAPPGYYLLLATATLWPAAMFVVPAFVRAVKLRKAASLRFCLAWAIPAWIMFEIVPTKLPHYVLPAYPALCLLAGVALTSGSDIYRHMASRVYLALAALIGPGLAVAAWVMTTKLDTPVTTSLILASIIAALSGFVPATLARRDRFREAAATAVIGALLTFACLTHSVFPGYDAFWLSRTVARDVAPGTPAAAAGYHEPSLVFLLGTKTQLTDGAGAAQFLLRNDNGAAIVESAEEKPFLATLADAGRSAHRTIEADGWNYSRGRKAHLTVWRLEPRL